MTKTETEKQALITQIEAELKKRESTQARDDNFSYLFAELTGRPEENVLAMIHGLVERTQFIAPKSAAIVNACENIWTWYKQAKFYTPLSSPGALLSSIESHDPAWVWATLLGQGTREGGPNAS